MVAKKQVKAAKQDNSNRHTEPIFPYTNKPGSLRKFLQEIPNKPKPVKVDGTLLQSWGFRDTNDLSILRVLRKVGLIGSTNEPTDLYTQFMNLKDGAAAIAKPIREIYAPLFTASHTPYKESAETLKNLFNIHSGGSQKTLEFQISTFKALAESTNFDSVPISGTTTPSPTGASGAKGSGTNPPQQVPVHINLHIHLPENKTRRDYETIIEDIGRYIFGQNLQGRTDE